MTGERLFAGEDLTETLASVVKEEPRWNRVPEKYSVCCGRVL